MQIRYSLLIAALGFSVVGAVAQTTFIPLWAKENWMLDRLEIKAQSNLDLNLSTVKPYMRKAYVAVADSFRKMIMAGEIPHQLTTIDQYNLNRFQANNSEYSSFSAADIPDWKSKNGSGKGLFPTKGNAVEVNQPGFYMSLNPAVSIQQSIESDYDNPVFFRAFGATGRGLIGKKIGFQFLATANSEMGPLPFREFVQKTTAVPGTVKYSDKNNGESYAYSDIRGSISFPVTKYINIQAGRDQQFIGNGYRSLFFSNFSAPHTFLKINTRIWIFNYTNHFLQIAPSPFADFNKKVDKKYISMHHLSANPTKWLTIGFFESIAFGREKGYDLSYLQPMIFLRSIEQQNGSPDNANIGFDVKANIAKRVQLYGQLMIDELKIEEAVGSKQNWWGNKQGFQLGAKYVDAFGIHNLDLQGEMNQVRPFMYQFRDTSGSYANALQPLAHPLGANFREFIGILKYQPMNKLYILSRLQYWKQGLDSAGFNFGSNPNESYNKVGSGGTRPRDDNFPLFSGMLAKGFNASLTASYELKENLFVEVNGMYRIYDEANKTKVTSTVFSFGFRWNMYRRDYDY